MATEENKPNEQNDNQENEPKVTIEDLQTRLAALEAENTRYKNAISKANAESADWKRKFRERQSAEEQAADAKREAEEMQKQQMAQLSKELGIFKAKARYMKQNMDEKTAEECAQLEVEGDMEGLMSKISAHNTAYLEAQQKAWKEEYLKSRPDINGSQDENGENEVDPFLKGFDNPDVF